MRASHRVIYMIPRQGCCTSPNVCRKTMHKVAICNCRATRKVTAVRCSQFFLDNHGMPKNRESFTRKHVCALNRALPGPNRDQASEDTSEEMLKFSEKSSTPCLIRPLYMLSAGRPFSYIRPSYLTVLWNAEAKPQEGGKPSCLFGCWPLRDLSVWELRCEQRTTHAAKECHPFHKETN